MDRSSLGMAGGSAVFDEENMVFPQPRSYDELEEGKTRDNRQGNTQQQAATGSNTQQRGAPRPTPGRQGSGAALPPVRGAAEYGARWRGRASVGRGARVAPENVTD